MLPADCYRFADRDMWLIGNKFTPDSAGCTAWVLSREGPLPVGDAAWRVHVSRTTERFPKT